MKNIKEKIAKLKGLGFVDYRDTGVIVIGKKFNLKPSKGFKKEVITFLKSLGSDLSVVGTEVIDPSYPRTGWYNVLVK